MYILFKNLSLEFVISSDFSRNGSFIINEIVDGYFKDGYSSVVDSMIRVTSVSSEMFSETSGTVTNSSSNQDALLQCNDRSVKKNITLKPRKQQRRTKQSRRYVVKRIQEDSNINTDQNKLFSSLVDLAIEANMLSIIDNPNIISLKGVSTSSPGTTDYFLVLDRLVETLEQRLMVWKKKDTKLSSPWSKLMLRTKSIIKRQLEFNVERCHVALDVACAIKYLHSMK
jgi:hypothetical protein